MKNLFLWFFALLCSVIPAPTVSVAENATEVMTISYEKPRKQYERILGSAWTIFLNGKLDSSAGERFAAFLIKNQVPIRSVVVLNSPGGNLFAGIELGRIIRKYGLSTDVGSRTNIKDVKSSYGPGECYSACTYAYLGGEFRYMSNKSRFGVHRFYADKSSEGNMDLAQVTSAQIVNYLREMNIDADFFALSTIAAPDSIIEPPLKVLESLNVVNNGIGPTTWTLESNQGILYLKGQRETQFGINKFMLSCSDKLGIILYMIFDPQGRQDEVLNMHAHSLVINGRDEPINILENSVENGMFNGLYLMSKSQLSNLMKATSVGVILRWSYESPIFLGFNEMPFDKGREKIEGLVNNCRFN